MTSPLNVSKRDPRIPPLPNIPRRTSSSYKHLRSNNLVSKSPFKSSIPTPVQASAAPPLSPIRRVSAEKRPRPSSMHEQAENERPLGLKRERKQSTVFQGLLQTEPVTKSPFKQHGYNPPTPNRTPIPQPPFSPSKLQNTMNGASSAAAMRSTQSPSPVRSSLVSRRLHGPRLSGTGRRERRKTVTFDERCDVVEFDRDPTSDDEDVFEDSEDEYDHEEIPSLEQQDNLFFQTPPALAYGSDSSQEFDLDLDVDASLTGIVDSMLARAATPDRSGSLPPDTETEDGVPLGRSHHAQRHAERAAESRSLPSPDLSPISRSQNMHPECPSTPPLQALSTPPSSPPLGRTTHAERAQAARQGEREGEQSIAMLPPSPSPMKNKSRIDIDEDLGLIPKLDLSGDLGSSADKDERYNDTLAKNEGFPSAESFASFCSELEQKDDMEESDISYSSCASGHDDDATSATSVPSATTGPRSSGSTSAYKAAVARASTISPLSPKTRRLSGSSLVTPAGSPRQSLSLYASGSPNMRRMVSPPPGSHARSSAGVSPHHIPSPPQIHHQPVRVTGSPLARSGSPLTRFRSASPFSPAGSPGARQRIDRDEMKKRLLRRQSEEEVSRHSSPRNSSTLVNSKGQGQFSLDVGGDVFDDHTNTSMQLDSSRIDSDAIQEITSATIERVVVEKLAVGTVAISAADVATGRDTQESDDENDNDISITNSSVSGLAYDKFDAHEDESDALAQAAVEFASSAATERREQSMEPKPASATAKASFSGLDIDFGGKFGLNGLTNMLDGSRSTRASVGDMDVDMEMRSALDRLMEDVASTNGSITSLDRASSKGKQRVESVVGHDAFKSPPMSRNASNASVAMMTAPPLPSKDDIHVGDNRRMREELILQKRREARIMEDEEEKGQLAEYSVPARREPSSSTTYLGVGRPSRRRSMSTGDAEDIGRRASASSGMLGRPSFGKDQDELTDSINRELEKLEGTEMKKKTSKYHIREREVIYASSDTERVSHMNSAGDVNTGKAWKPVRRPSDMNEYSKQIKELRALEKPGKAHGKVFVRVVGVKSLDLPLPSQLTLMTCTLNNGIHYVTTPECQLQRDARVEQEFELIEHSKLEFTLTLKVKRDPHIIAQFKSMVPTAVPAPPAPPPVAAPSSSRGGMFSFLSSSPKKSKEKLNAPPISRPPSSQPQRIQLHENLARYLKPDGTLARAFISFKEIAQRCDTRLFETTYPLIGQKLEQGNKVSSLQIGEIVLQMFRLPPLPGISQDKLPQSLEECHRGLRHVNWHKVTYFEGILTQNGGDCTSWRRRQMRIIGANLVAFNDVTKRATATIDLRKATAIEDDQVPSDVTSPMSVGRSVRSLDEYESLYGVERSFRLIFQDNQEITFFADTDEEKKRWLEVLRALIGRIPPNPLWAEMLFQRQAETNKQNAASGLPRPNYLAQAGPSKSGPR